jgi:hypothetical protein
MFDGAQLGESIVAHSGDLEAALADYEDPMFVRSAVATAEAAKTHALCNADPDAPHGLVAFLSGAAPPA